MYRQHYIDLVDRNCQENTGKYYILIVLTLLLTDSSCFLLSPVGFCGLCISMQDVYQGVFLGSTPSPSGEGSKISEQNEKNYHERPNPVTSTKGSYKRCYYSTYSMFEIIHLKKLSPNLMWGAINKSQTKLSATSVTLIIKY